MIKTNPPICVLKLTVNIIYDQNKSTMDMWIEVNSKYYLIKTNMKPCIKLHTLYTCINTYVHAQFYMYHQLESL